MGKIIMYLRELYDLDEAFITQQNGSSWDLIDDTTNKVVMSFSNRQDAESSAAQKNQQLGNTGNNNNNNNNGNTGKKKGNNTPSNPDGYAPKRKSLTSNMTYLGKARFKLNVPNSPPIIGSAQKVVDEYVNILGKTNPKAAKRIKAKKLRYYNMAGQMVINDKMLNWSGKLFGVLGSSVAFMDMYNTIVNEAAAIEIARELIGFQEQSDPTGDAIHYLITEAITKATIEIALIAKFSGKAIKLARVLRSGALFAGPPGWIFLILSELALQGAASLIAEWLDEYAAWVVDFFIGKPLSRVVRLVRDKSFEITTDQDSTTDPRAMKGAILGGKTELQQWMATKNDEQKAQILNRAVDNSIRRIEKME